VAGRGTALYDAVLLASDELMKKQSGRKALIILSDGVDRGSKVTIETAIDAAHRADTLVYSILFADEQPFSRGGFGGPGFGGRHGGGMGRSRENRPDGKKILQQISRETGGGFFQVSKKQPLEQTYAHIDEELRSQYSLGFNFGSSRCGPGLSPPPPHHQGQKPSQSGARGLLRGVVPASGDAFRELQSSSRARDVTRNAYGPTL